MTEKPAQLSMSIVSPETQQALIPDQVFIVTPVAICSSSAASGRKYAVFTVPRLPSRVTQFWLNAQMQLIVIILNKEISTMTLLPSQEQRATELSAVAFPQPTIV